MKTLDSFRQYNPDDFEVVIVDDASDKDIVLPELPFRVTVVKMKGKYWTNPEPAYNVGIKLALTKNPDIIILQNAECWHGYDILGFAREHLHDGNYITFGCYSQGEGEEPGSVMNNHGATFDGESAWYNHSIYRPVAYDFCSAITANNIRKLNGYDERFSYGVVLPEDPVFAPRESTSPSDTCARSSSKGKASRVRIVRSLTSEHENAELARGSGVASASLRSVLSPRTPARA